MVPLISKLTSWGLFLDLFEKYGNLVFLHFGFVNSLREYFVAHPINIRFIHFVSDRHGGTVCVFVQSLEIFSHSAYWYFTLGD